jgi:DNA-binding response OmpR family regulator
LTIVEFMDNKNILLIEDDPAVALSLRKGLERDGYEVVWKSQGEDGISYAQRRPPHLIILDVRLPDGSGFDICRRMRQAGMHQPILILTAQSDEIDKILGLEIGADDYMTKPFSLRELLTRIRVLLRRAYGEFASAHSNLLLVGSLTIDLNRNEVKRHDEQLDLTPTEFKLLVFLAQHPGQALSRTQIIEAIWRNGAELESASTVNVYIRRLREKVELDPSRPMQILTVPGVGYRLVK